MSIATTTTNPSRLVFVEAAKNAALTHLTVRSLGILQIMANESGPHTVRGLAASLKVAKPCITRLTQSLENAGLLRRITDQNDRRSVMLHLTPAGTKVIRAAA